MKCKTPYNETNNYNSQLAYFAIRFDDERKSEAQIWCYAIPSEKLSTIQKNLHAFKNTGYDNYTVRQILRNAGARPNDFSDEQAKKIYPGKMICDESLKNILRVEFHGDEGISDPNEILSGRIFFKSKHMAENLLEHFSKNRPYDPSHTDQLGYADTYRLQNFLQDPKTLLGLPKLKENQSAVILKFP